MIYIEKEIKNEGSNIKLQKSLTDYLNCALTDYHDVKMDKQKIKNILFKVNKLFELEDKGLNFIIGKIY